ncbi:MAG: copper chaperone PCu(A)C [Streptosporangiales bacterium]|nr:copper chaperone PCu(A)C [Streptosporangiales bacterium]
MSARTCAVALGSAAVLAISATGCADGAAAPTSTPTAKQAATVRVVDPWVKAADKGMTAVFGTLRNPSGTDVRVTSATTSASPVVELHETTRNGDGDAVMRPKKGGFVVEAGGRHVLSPGGDHVMLMDVAKPIMPGDSVRVSLVFADGSRKAFEAPARSFSGAKESYRSHDHG